MKEFIIIVCTDSTEIFFSKLRSAGLNYNLPSFFTDSTVRGVSNKHCLLTFFIKIYVLSFFEWLFYTGFTTFFIEFIMKTYVHIKSIITLSISSPVLII